MKKKEKNRRELLEENLTLRKKIAALERQITRHSRITTIQQELRTKFESIVKYSPMGIHLYELNEEDTLVLVNANPAADLILEIKHANLIGETIENAFPLLRKSKIPGIFMKVAREGMPWKKDEVSFSDSRIKGIFEIHAFQTYPGGMASIFIDITQRKKSDLALKESREKYRSIFETLKDVYYKTDANGRVKIISPSVQLQSGYRQDEMIGRMITKLIINPGEHDAFIRRLKKAGTVIDYEMKIRKKSGKMLTVSANSHAIFNDDNEYMGEEGIIRDITRRKRIEENLRQSEEQFKIIFQSAPDAYYLSDTKGHFIDGNTAAEKLLGYKKEELIGQTYLKLKLLSKDQIAKALDNLEKNLKGLPTGPDEFTLSRKDSKEVIVEISTVPVKIRNRSLILGIARDITLRKQTERALLLAKQKAEAANRAKSDFLTNISHELRTPLNAIIGFSQVLEGQHFGLLNKKQSDYVNYISESGHHLLEMINEILDLSRIEVGKMKLERSDIYISDLLESSIIMVKEKCLKHGIELALKVNKTMQNRPINIDERRIKQVMFNLLINASKFTPDGGSIKVEAAKKDGSIEICVSDTGIGIPKKYQKKIFEPFYQVKGGLKDKTSGLGLGLNLCKRIVEKHEGKIWVESQGKGKGSVFKVSLPLSVSN